MMPVQEMVLTFYDDAGAAEAILMRDSSGKQSFYALKPMLFDDIVRLLTITKAKLSEK